MRRAASLELAGGGLLLIALAFDSAPLLVPAIALLALGALTPAWLGLAARGGRVRRRLHAERVIEGEPVHATIEVSRGRLWLPGAEVIDPLPGGSLAVSEPLAPVRGARKVRLHVVARFSRRGAKHLAPPALLVKDPLGLAAVQVLSREPDQKLLVLPRTEPVRWAARGMDASARPPAHPSAEPLSTGELDGLRPYRLGTPASRIHWAALARGAGLLERRLRSEGDSHPLVVLDARCRRPDEELDAAVRAAASLVLELARAGGCGLLLPGQRRAVEVEANLLAWPSAHVQLALVAGGPDSPPPSPAAGSRVGRVFYVAVEPPQRLPAALARDGRLPGILVLPEGHAHQVGPRAGLEVAGCQGFLLAGGQRSRAAERVA